MEDFGQDYVKSHVNSIVLTSLLDGDKYGLEIIKYIKDQSKGKLEMKQPTLYSCLKRLEGLGFINSYWQDSEIGGRRHYYGLTDLGKDELKKIETNWNNEKQVLTKYVYDKTTEQDEKTDGQVGFFNDKSAIVDQSNSFKELISQLKKVNEDENVKQPLQENEVTSKNNVETEQTIEEKIETAPVVIETKQNKEELNDAVFITERVKLSKDLDAPFVKQDYKERRSENLKYNFEKNQIQGENFNKSPAIKSLKQNNFLDYNYKTFKYAAEEKTKTQKTNFVNFSVISLISIGIVFALSFVLLFAFKSFWTAHTKGLLISISSVLLVATLFLIARYILNPNQKHSEIVPLYLLNKFALSVVILIFAFLIATLTKTSMLFSGRFALNEIAILIASFSPFYYGIFVFVLSKFKFFRA